MLAPAETKQLEPGIYLGLDEEIYHRDLSLGSGDMRNLLLSPCDYYWGSSLNPNREDDENDDTPARIRGRAMHKLVLQGEAEYDREYMCGARNDAGMTPAEKGAATKAANARAAQLGLVALPAKDYDRIAIAAAMITKNPKLAGAFQGGIPEVSVFWERDGVRRKARIDYLKPRGVGDLKSITNIKKIEFRRACREAIANYRYDIQAAHYLEGRAALPRLVAEGRIFGPEGGFKSVDEIGEHADLLKRIALMKSFAFQIVFFQASKAPVTWSTIITPHDHNPLYQTALADLETAAGNYREFMEKFGPGNIWLMLDEPAELDIESMPGWYARRG
jgi:hypothetical protein